MEYFLKLGITDSSSDREIERIYRKLALKYHPDKNKSSESEAIFKEIGEAKTVLTERTKSKPKKKVRVVPPCHICGKSGFNSDAAKCQHKLTHAPKLRCVGCLNQSSRPDNLARHQLTCRGKLCNVLAFILYFVLCFYIFHYFL